MSALWHGFSWGAVLFVTLAGCMLLAAVVRAANTVDDDALLLWAIAERDSGNNPDAIGSRGEFTRYQFMPETWRHYTDATPEQARRNPEIADAVARMHLADLKDELRRGGLKPTPRLLALAWNAGSPAVIRRELLGAHLRYAEHVVNLYTEAAR